MLSRQNRKLFKSLVGEYKKFARRLKNELFDRCQGIGAINESLEEVFSMLAAAQSEMRRFDEVIPDPEGFIKETALCFPTKRSRRLIAVLSCLLAIMLVGGSAWMLISQYGPVVLRSVTYVSYDEKNNYLYWEPIENAFEYNLYVDGAFYKTTSGNGCFLTDVDEKNVKIAVKACGQEGSRYHDGEVSKEFAIKPEYAAVSLTLQNEYTTWEKGEEDEDYKWRTEFVTFGSKAYNVGKVYFTPEYTFYGRIMGYGYTPITKLKENELEIEYTEERWYYGGKEYEFTLTKIEDVYWDFGIKLGLLNIQYAQELTIPQGDVLFTKGYMHMPNIRAYKEASGKITFADVDAKNIKNHGEFFDSFATYSFNRVNNFEDLLLVRNEGEAKKLKFVENKVTPETLNGELNLKNGYTMVEMSDVWALAEEENNSGGDRYFCLRFKVSNDAVCKILNVQTTENMTQAGRLDEYLHSWVYNCLFHRQISADYLGRIIIYTEEDITMYSQFLEEDDTLSLSDGQQTFTIDPGVTVFSRTSGFVRYLLRSSSLMYVQPYFGYTFEDWQVGYEFLLSDELIVFNPYDEPIKVIAYGVTLS